MNKLVVILDKVSAVRDALGGDAFNEIPDLEYAEVVNLLNEIEEEVVSVRDDGEFEVEE